LSLNTKALAKRVAALEAKLNPPESPRMEVIVRFVAAEGGRPAGPPKWIDDAGILHLRIGPHGDSDFVQT